MAKDLVILVADKNIDSGVRGLLSRPAALGIRPVDCDLFVHLRRDPGCLHEAHDFLRPFVNEYNYALVIFDRVGSGREDRSADALSEEVGGRVAAAGWGERSAVVVLDPELEVWVFAPTPQVERCLEWPARRRSLRSWLESRGLWETNHTKPSDPKAALERALYEIKKPRSAAIYKRLGEKVSVRRCTDPAFIRLRTILATWFRPGTSE